jgi:hypothetical protein
VFTLQVIAPMPLSDLVALLAARYRHLVLDPKRPFTNPVTRDAVASLYGCFVVTCAGCSRRWMKE